MNEIEIISEDINQDINQNLLKYDNLTKHLYYLNNGYRALTYNEAERVLQYTIKSTNQVVTITNIQNTLRGKSVKVNGITKQKVDTIRLVNDIYIVTFR